MTIWINEQIDSCGLVQACIAGCNEDAARDCHETWLKNLTEEQKETGWTAVLRTVESWEDVPVNALKLSY
ncbi:glycogen debranching protein [Pannus brasiliensis CCIBt3594]|uniref:Glycogen debranching protein n=1 Tax=Pannus brasiliensis CCIBt3594 TaxID=1427578 RepID=A0AAW9QWT5_9CHRO